MSTWLRSALMWVLVAALPLQAVSAVTMLHCNSEPNRAAYVHDHAQGPVHRHDGSAMRGHQHRHHVVDSVVLETASAPIQTAAPSTDGRSVWQTSPHDVKGKCSACASCCTATALPPAIRSFDATPSTDFFAPFMPLVTAVFITAGPERPPRPVLA